MTAKERPVLVYTTYPSLVEAEQAGAALVEAGLAACVNIVPGMRSIYRWQGRLERADEVVMFIKTISANRKSVAAKVRERHSYDNPAILFLPADGGAPDYIAWIVRESAGSKI